MQVMTARGSGPLGSVDNEVTCSANDSDRRHLSNLDAEPRRSCQGPWALAPGRLGGGRQGRNGCSRHLGFRHCLDGSVRRHEVASAPQTQLRTGALLRGSVIGTGGMCGDRNESLAIHRPRQSPPFDGFLWKSVSMTVDGDLSLRRGDFGEAWLAAVAAGCKFLQGKPTRVDGEKADLELVFPGELSDVVFPCVKVQVKATSASIIDSKSRDLLIDLDVDTYDFLRMTNHAVARALVVIHLDHESDWVDVQPERTHPLGRGGWVSLLGAPPTQNQQTVRIRIPAANRLDRECIERMLRETGRRMSTPSPDVDSETSK